MLVDGSCFIVLSGSLCFDNIGEKCQDLNRGMRDMQSHHMSQEYISAQLVLTQPTETFPLSSGQDTRLVVLAIVAPFGTGDRSTGLAAFLNGSTWHQQVHGGQSE